MFEKARTEMVKDNATKRELTKDTKINLKQVLDAGKPEGTVSHRKNGDFIKQGGEWKPYKAGNGSKENNTLPYPDEVHAAGYSLRGSGTNPKSRGGEYKIYKGGSDGIPEEIRYDETGYDERAKGKQFSTVESGPGGQRRFFDSFQEAAEWLRKEKKDDDRYKEKLMQEVRKTWKPIQSIYYDADRAIESPDGKVSVHEVKPGRLYKVKKPGGMYTLISKSIESAAVYAIKHSR